MTVDEEDPPSFRFTGHDRKLAMQLDQALLAAAELVRNSSAMGFRTAPRPKASIKQVPEMSPEE